MMNKEVKLCAVVLALWAAFATIGCDKNQPKESYSIPGARVSITAVKDADVKFLGLNYLGQVPIYKEMHMRVEDYTGAGIRYDIDYDSNGFKGSAETHFGTIHLSPEDIGKVIQRYGDPSKILSGRK